MIIEIRESGRPEIPFEFSSAPDLDDDAARISGTVKVAGTLRRTGGRVEVEGRVEGVVECDCVRCLKPVNVEIDFPFHDVFVTAELFENRAESEVGQDELDVSVFDGQQIDLADVAREQILLFLPEQVFCSRDCLGLCAKCGANLNTGTCGCSVKEIDPRWSGLENIKF